MSMERAVGGLRGQGISTRNGGAPVILQLRNAGYDGGPQNIAGTADANGVLVDQGGVAATRFDTRKMDDLLMIVVFSMDIVLRTGSCEIRE